MSALMRCPDLTIVGPLQRDVLKAQGLTVRDLGREYGARFVLDGSTQWSNGHLRVRAKLFDSQQNKHVWAESYQYALNTDDWFTVEDTIVSRIVATLVDTFGVIPRTLARHSRPQDERNGIVYDAKELLDDVAKMVEEAKMKSKATEDNSP